MKKVGLISIATGKYIQFTEQFYRSCDKYFLNSKCLSVEYILFTDTKKRLSRTKRKIVIQPQQPYPWPFPTLLRYSSFTKKTNLLSKYDYLFYCDIDMCFVSKCSDDILGERVGTLHPGYIGTIGLPERNPRSTAYIDPKEKNKYYCGGFNGGSSKEFLEMADRLSKNIRRDLECGIIASWHDESHLNRFFLDRPPTNELSPAFCFDPLLKEKLQSYRPILKALPKKNKALLRSNISNVCLVFHKNAEKTYTKQSIERFKNSILNQSLKEFDVLEINYGTGKDRIFQNEGNHKILFFRKKMPNHAEAENFLFQEAKKRNYQIAFIVHVDDLYSPYRFERQLSSMSMGKDLVASNFFYFKEEKSHPKICHIMNESEKGPINKLLHQGYNPIAHPSVAIRLGRFGSFKLNSKKIPQEDYDLWLKKVKACRYFIDSEYLLYHQIHPNQVSSTKNRNEWAKKLKLSSSDQGVVNSNDVFMHLRMLQYEKKITRNNIKRPFLWLGKTLVRSKYFSIINRPNARVHLVSLGCLEHPGSQQCLEKNRKRHLFADTHFQYTREWLDGVGIFQKYPQFNWRQKRGGYGFWKPFLLSEVIKKIPENDILLYLNVFDGVDRDISGFLQSKMAKNYSSLFMLSSFIPAYVFTKRDAFIFGGYPRYQYQAAFCVEGNFCAFKNDPVGRDHLAKWLSICSDIRCISNEESKTGPENAKFVCHRNETALLNFISLSNRAYRSREISPAIVASMNLKTSHSITQISA